LNPTDYMTSLEQVETLLPRNKVWLRHFIQTESLAGFVVYSFDN
jgi:hypothetical protein